MPGFVVHAFADGASLLGSLASVINADVAVLDWDLPTMPAQSCWLNCASMASTCPSCS